MKIEHKLLEEFGFEIECESPFEISHRDVEGGASKVLAHLIQDYLQLLKQPGNEDELESVRDWLELT